MFAWITRPLSAVSALVLGVVSHHRGGHYTAVAPRVGPKLERHTGRISVFVFSKPTRQGWQKIAGVSFGGKGGKGPPEQR